MQLRLDGANEVTPLVQTPFAERNGEVSPDGRWLAFEANDTGQFEIYVTAVSRRRRPLAGVNWRRAATALGASDSQELFYLAPTGALMRVGVGRGATWAATVPAKLFDVGRYYTGSTTAASVGCTTSTPTASRFLMIKPGGGSESTPAPTAPTSLVVVQHFDEELKRRLPVK